MMMMKLALALMLAISGVNTFAAKRAWPLSTRGVEMDGVNSRMQTHRTTKRRKAARRIKDGGLRPGSRIGSKLPANPRGGRPAVLPDARIREIDADGLKKLLERGDATTARPLLVNFWATWCVPCRVEFPDLVKIDADYRGRGLEFVLVSADEVGEIKTGVPQFLNLMRANLIPAYLLNAIDTQAAIAQVDPAWGGELPATFLFDARGQLVYKHTGPIKPAELRAALEKVISDK